VGGGAAVAATGGPPVGTHHSTPPLPARPGTYALFLRLDRERVLTIGRLGHFHFPAGLYAYVGSARGPGGLAARIARHLRRSKPLRWHIDYLRPHTRPVAVWLTLGVRRRECAWAQGLAAMEHAAIPAPGFGASDCRCPAHLIHFPTMPDRERFERLVGEAAQHRLIHSDAVLP